MLVDEDQSDLDECEGSANNDSTIIPFFIEVQ
jgi:hypothetical protein